MLHTSLFDCAVHHSTDSGRKPETSTFTKALFLWFSVHYVFHLSYSTILNDFCTFFQEFVFGLPAKGKRGTSYLTTATDIQQFTVK